MAASYALYRRGRRMEADYRLLDRRRWRMEVDGHLAHGCIGQSNVCKWVSKRKRAIYTAQCHVILGHCLRHGR